MKTLRISRLYLDECTVGRVQFGGFKCLSLELPWLANKKNISCIPGGIGQRSVVYYCCKIYSEKLGECFEVMNVPGRTHIRGHVANYTRQIQGCIAFGDSVKDIDYDGILDVTNSKHTFERLMSILPNEFNLEIR